MTEDPRRSSEIEFGLSVKDADACHAALERVLDAGHGDTALEHLYRTIGWKLVASRGGEGFTGTMADLARRADTLEDYEKARDEWLGPIIGGLENPENRDP